MFNWIITALNHPLFVIGSDHVTSAEILGFVFGALCVYLLVVQNIWNFPTGMINNVMFLVLFLNAKLFADAWLQVFYLILAAIGWVAWLKAGPQRTELHVSHTKWWQMGLALAFVGGFTVFFTPFLRDLNDIAPTLDALTTGLSIAATGLLTWKKIENWYLWIAADLIYIPLYFAKNLYLTGVVYILFLILCFMGLAAWNKAHREEEPIVAEPVPA
jgi:nicotinamide mononucleotide transporter